MKAVILAAGASRRLRPLTDHTPKCLLSVGGKPILRRLIDDLMAIGIDGFVVVTGYLEHAIHDAVAAWFPGLDVAFVSNPDFETTNTTVSTLLARPFVAGQTFLLIDGDIVCEAGVSQALIDSPLADCVALRRADDLGEEEVKLELDSDGRVLRIGKPNVPLDVAVGESIGIEKFSPGFAARMFDMLEHRTRDLGGGNELREVTYQYLVDEGLAMHAVDVSHLYCAEIDTPSDLEIVDRQLAERGLAYERDDS